MNKAERQMRGRIGGLTTAARGHVNTGPAREAMALKFYAGIPDDATPAEREARALAARKLFYARLTLASSLARSRKRHRSRPF